VGSHRRLLHPHTEGVTGTRKSRRGLPDSGEASSAARWCQGPESNWRHRTFQARALPTELPWLDFVVGRTAFFAMRPTKLATLMGLEPTTFAVTGRRSNQLSYSAKTGTAGLGGGHGWARTSDPPRVKRMLSR
jgi:hypothetical protein